MRRAIAMIGGPLLAVAGFYIAGVSHGKPIGFLGVCMVVVGVVAFMYGGGYGGKHRGGKG